MGDRLFRGNNIKKAEERYGQATRLDPSSAAPLIGLAQIALVRVQYGEAARRLREAETAQPGWIVTAPDVQSIYGEPGDFARHLARLESHLQVHPDDRDAWLVLGTEWYLSGRTAPHGRRLPSALRSQAQAGYRPFGLSPRHKSGVTATPQPRPTMLSPRLAFHVKSHLLARGTARIRGTRSSARPRDSFLSSIIAVRDRQAEHSLCVTTLPVARAVPGEWSRAAPVRP